MLLFKYKQLAMDPKFFLMTFDAWSEETPFLWSDASNDHKDVKQPKMCL